MAVETTTDAGLLALMNQGNRSQDGFGTNSLMGIAALRLLMPGYGAEGNNGGARPLTANDVQNIVNDSQAAVTANSNFGILLKDIQDSSQGITQSVLQGQIANLQGQKDLTTVVMTGQANLSNNVSEHSAEVKDAVVNGNSNVINAINHLTQGVTVGFANVTQQVLESKYATAIAIAADGNATRAAIADLKDTIPNARELDLQRQLTVALDNERHRDVIGRIDSGNVTVTTNVAQAQSQQQQQLQLQNLTNQLACLTAHQQATANNVNILGVQRGVNQTPVNVN